MISSQDEKGEGWKFKLYPVYGVFLQNFKSGKTNKLRTDIVLADRETGKQMSDTIHQVYLEMPFFTKKEEECKTSLDYWLYTLIHMENLDTLPFKGKKELNPLVDVPGLLLKRLKPYRIAKIPAISYTYATTTLNGSCFTNN